MALLVPTEIWVHIFSYLSDPPTISRLLQDPVFGPPTSISVQCLFGPDDMWHPTFQHLESLIRIDLTLPEPTTPEILRSIASLPKLDQVRLKLNTHNYRLFLECLREFQTTYGKTHSFRGNNLELSESMLLLAGSRNLVYTIIDGVPLLESHAIPPSLSFPWSLTIRLEEALAVLQSFRQVAPLWCYDNRWQLIIAPTMVEISTMLSITQFLRECPELREVRATCGCANNLLVQQLLPNVEVFRLDGPGWIWDLPPSSTLKILDARIDITHEDMAQFSAKYPCLEELSIRAPWALKEGLDREIYRDFWDHFLSQLRSLPQSLRQIQVIDLGSQWQIPRELKVVVV
jgi:hypothetical protein